MARRAQIQYPGALSHLINRGNYGIFEELGTRRGMLVLAQLTGRVRLNTLSA